MTINNIYLFKGERMRLKKIHPNGIHVFQIIDEYGFDIVLRKNGIMIDYGKRIIKNNLSEVMPENKTESVQLNLFNN